MGTTLTFHPGGPGSIPALGAKIFQNIFSLPRLHWKMNSFPGKWNHFQCSRINVWFPRRGKTTQNHWVSSAIVEQKPFLAIFHFSQMFKLQSDFLCNFLDTAWYVIVKCVKLYRQGWVRVADIFPPTKFLCGVLSSYKKSSYLAGCESRKEKKTRKISSNQHGEWRNWNWTHQIASNLLLHFQEMVVQFWSWFPANARLLWTTTA